VTSAEGSQFLSLVGNGGFSRSRCQG
jgi:hypothetical protein